MLGFQKKSNKNVKLKVGLFKTGCDVSDIFVTCVLFKPSSLGKCNEFGYFIAFFNLKNQSKGAVTNYGEGEGGYKTGGGGEGGK